MQNSLGLILVAAETRVATLLLLLLLLHPYHVSIVKVG